MTRALIARLERLEASVTTPAHRAALCHAVAGCARLMDRADGVEADDATYAALESDLAAKLQARAEGGA